MVGELEQRLVALREGNEDPVGQHLRAGLRKRLLDAESPPVKVDRFVILDRIGAGAMGVVFSAYDPKLDRKIALKLLAADTVGARGLEEARALAKLNHPNVVALHDVGGYDGGSYLAMALIAGRSLREWLSERPRSKAEVLPVLLAAGRGLAAAHAAGVVHRDFKPANVLIGDDGQVYVADFGVARAQPGAEGVPGADAFAVERSVTRGLVGTPAYMAPEQLRGGAADVRTDQFAYAVTLFEALAGRRPFDGDTVETLLTSTESGVPSFPIPLRIPAFVRAVVRRGLSPSPAERFESMDDLLKALGRDPRRRYQIAGTVVLAGGVVAALAVRPDGVGTDTRCTGSAAALADVWSPERADEVASALDAVQPAALGANRWIVGELEAYAAEWIEGHRDNCEATAVRGEQSDASMDLRSACFQRAKDALDGVAKRIASADVAAAQRAHRIVVGLPKLDRCSDLGTLGAERPRVADPRRRERIEALRQKLASAREAGRAGDFESVATIVDEMRDAVAAVDYEPLTAEHVYLLGGVAARRGDYEASDRDLRRALDLAVSNGMSSVAAHAAAQLARSLGVRGDLSAAVAYAELSVSLARQVGPKTELLATALVSLSRVRTLEARHTEAIAGAQESLAINRELYGDEHPQVALALQSLAEALAGEHRFSDAEIVLAEAAAIQENLLSVHSPEAMVVASTRARIARKAGRYEEAAALYEQIVATLKPAYGEASSKLLTVYYNQGNTLLDLGRHDEARAIFEHAAAVASEKLGPDHVEVGFAMDGLGRVLEKDLRYADAEAAFRRSLAILRARLGDEHEHVMAARTNLVGTLADLERYEEAEAEMRALLGPGDGALPEGHVYRTTVLDVLGGVLTATGRADEAVQVLEQAWQRRQAEEARPGTRGVTAFGLAVAKWEAGHDHEGAAAIARQAAQLFAQSGPGYADRLEEVTTWLDDHVP